MQHNVVDIGFGEDSYKINIASGMISQAGSVLASATKLEKICVVVDENVARHHFLSLVRSLVDGGFNVLNPVIINPDGKRKDFTQVQYVVEKCLEQGLDEKTLLVAFGGGFVLDIAGFAASIIYGGIEFAQIPTSLIAQLGSTANGKSMLDIGHNSSAVYSARLPRAVLIDIDLLATLPKRHMTAGYSEILRYAFINKPEFFRWLELRAQDLLEGRADVLQYAIETILKEKTDILDKERRRRKQNISLLSLGEDFVRALEKVKGYDGSCTYGETLGIGVWLACELSYRFDLLKQSDFMRIKRHMEGLGLMMNPPFKVTGSDIFNFMFAAKNKYNSFVMTEGAGKAFIEDKFNYEDLKIFLAEKFG